MSGLTFRVTQNPKYKGIEVNVFTTGMDPDDSAWTAQNASIFSAAKWCKSHTIIQVPVVHHQGWSFWVL